ncbi:MAG: DciA family protein [Chromatiales bacterium]|nr:DciA family protein [Chromatiales bacterium]
MNKLSQLSVLLQQCGIASDGLLQHGQRLNLLEQLIKELLDSGSSLHFRLGNYRDNTLILYADSNAWASRLRYQAPALLTQLRKMEGLDGIDRIDVRVMPQEIKSIKKQHVSLSSAASSCIIACADGVSDEGLRNALRHLARHHKPD